MLEKAELKKPLKGGDKKRGQKGSYGGESKRKKADDESKAEGDAGKKRLDALSVGYYRRVGERLNEDFEDAEERGEFEAMLQVGSAFCWGNLIQAISCRNHFRLYNLVRFSPL